MPVVNYDKWNIMDSWLLHFTIMKLNDLYNRYDWSSSYIFYVSLNDAYYIFNKVYLLK
jgi:hypothetical protein